MMPHVEGGGGKAAAAAEEQNEFRFDGNQNSVK